ncbi:MAG: MFS transporter [Anaerolineae bacterium]|nr:MFS transporter [Anaerolineae bacterium]
MKTTRPQAQVQSCSLQGQSSPTLSVEKRRTIDRHNQTMLIGLMIPLLLMVINMTMFSVALPAIRGNFNLPADTTSWLVTAYSLPYVMTMPLYGRLSDGLGKRRLFLLGIVVFLGGTILSLMAANLFLLILGRAIQGLGVAGINPLCMAIIAERFPTSERGKALGTWNSVGPAAGILGPLLGGFLVDNFGWWTIFWPVLLVGLVALFTVYQQVSPAGRSFVKPGFLRSFDWGGVVLLISTTIMLVFYLSSRPITGVEPLQDWRLLVATLLSLGGFIVWEKRHPNPFVSFDIFSTLSFTRASVGAGLRMFLMSSIGFLLPLYLTDIYSLNAASIGTVVTIHAAALLVTMRLGGQLADRWNSRQPVVIGSSIQLMMMVFFALLPATASPGLVIVGLVVHGLGAGLSLAAFHRSAMSGIPNNQTGIAAGLYSMIRMGGTVLGVALGGVVLQFGLDHFPLMIKAYQTTFWFAAGVALLGVVAGWNLREE